MKLINNDTRIIIAAQQSALRLEISATGVFIKDTSAESALYALCTKALLQVLLQMKLEEKLNETSSINRLRKALGIADKYDRLFRELLRTLAGAGLVLITDAKVLLPDASLPQIKYFDLEAAAADFISTYPAFSAHLHLVKRCLLSLQSILKEETPATDIIFPGGSPEYVAGIYKGNAEADYFNDVLSGTIVQSVSNAVASLKEGDKIRILEVGAGTGGTSEILFQKLSPFKEKIEYMYTDISKSFLLYAEEKYKPVAPYLKTALFNIEASPVFQNLSPGTCDLVIGANVVHATRDIAATLTNIKAMLKKDGVLVLNEFAGTELFSTLTFGLLDGWWLYEDPELRLEGSPGLSPESWKTVLAEVGFSAPDSYPQGAHLSQQIVFAKSDGFIKIPSSRASENAVKSSLKNSATPSQSLQEAKVQTNLSGPKDNSWLRERLISIAADTIKLSREEFDAEEQFTDYGFDSILATTLVKNINEALDISLKATDVFNYPNIAQLSEYIGDAFPASLPVKNGGDTQTALSSSKSGKETSEATQSAGTPSRFISDADSSDNAHRGVHPDVAVRSGDIAIIGMSGQFGAAGNLDVYWQVLKEGKSLIEEVPAEKWDVNRHFNPDRSQPNSTYSKWGSFLRDTDKFDPMFFKISGSDAEMMDPQQRLFLEHCWKAIEDAAIHPQRLKMSRCAVYVGVGPGDYLDSIDNKEASAFWGNSSAILASRISYLLDLKGPAISIDTACSSSLVAMDLGCSSLQKGEADIVITGGVAIMNTPDFYKLASRAGMLSPTGQCYTFDKRADGFVPGEGVGVVVMKRLEDAVRDGDPIYGVIKGSLTNQDGTTNGITAPSALSQMSLEKEVYAKCGIHPETITYVEAHGTGTRLGDPIEFEALTGAFRSYTDRKQYCSIGSVKTNIGHTLTAAGIASVIKIMLSFRHKQLVPTINYQECNPLIDLAGSPFRIQDKLEPWQPEGNIPRRAVVSSFGFSGTNAHLVFEEYVPEYVENYSSSAPAVFVLSAKNADRLKEYAANLLQYLEQNEAANFFDIAYTFQVGREAMEERLAIIAKDITVLKSQLIYYTEGKPAEYFTGNIRKDRLEFLLKGEAGQAYIQKAMEVKELDALAQLWVKGVSVDWNLLYSFNKPCKINLPVYPFARERYWIPFREELKEQIGGKKLHPLLHANDSSFKEQKYSSIFTGKETFFEDHKVRESKVLPGVAYLEMARAAGGFSLEEKISGLSEIVWFSPIRIKDKTENVNIRLHSLNEKAGFEVFTEVDGEEEIHCEGFVSSGIAEQPSRQDVTAILSRLHGWKEQEACYRLFKEAGLNYGKSFQGIEKLYYSETEALSRISLQKEDGYVLSPGMLDSAVQTCAGLFAERQTFHLMLPYSVKEVSICGDVSQTVWCHVRKHGRDLAGAAMSCDIDLLSEAGNVLLRLKEFVFVPADGFTSAASGSDASLSTLLFNNSWQESETSDRSAVSAGTECCILLADGPAALADKLKESLEAEVEIVGGTSGDAYFIQVLEKVKRKIQEETPVHIMLICTNEDYLSYGFVSGMLKSAHLENPRITGKVIGVDRLSVQDLDTLCKIVETEKYTGEREVRYTGGKREVKMLSGHSISGKVQDAPQIREGGVYLITGGMGSLGRIFAEHIGRTKGTQLVLTGRSILDPERKEALKNMPQAEYYQCDVSVKEDVQSLMEIIRNKYGKLNGIIHSAGIIRDNLLVRKTAEEAREVLASKISGVKNLDEASKEEALDFIVFFSSLAGIMGNEGQADYASANAYLDNYAHSREELRHKGLRHGKTISIAWPVWKEGGMKIEEEKEAYLQRKWGLWPIPTQECIRAFERLLELPGSEQVVVYGKAGIIKDALDKRKEKQQETLKADSVVEVPGELRERAVLYFKELLSAELKFSQDKLELNAPFEKYGIDSVMINKLTNRLSEVFPEIPRTLFFEYQTLGVLIDYFIAEYPAKLQTLTGISGEVNRTAFQEEPSLKENRSKHPEKNKSKSRFTKASAEDRHGEPIAIIGISGRYPGARNIEEFWENLKQGKDSITEIPSGRWDMQSFYDGEKGKPGKSYSKWGGFIEDVDKFDPLFFNISPAEAETMDPQERLFLQAVWEAVEDAGYTRARLQETCKGTQSLGGQVGVYAGVMYEEYQLYGAEERLKGNFITPAGSPSSIANRVSYFFNFHGPSMAVDTMCSSSLTAIHLACESLRQGHCSAAIAGGVNVSVHPNKYLLLSQGRFVSGKGRCESFGEGGEGYVPSEGVGAVLLKRLSEAEADGDRIYGIIRGTALNHGGKTNGYTVPNLHAQAAVIREAMDRAGVKAEDFSYIEAHGTGTSLGDPIEIAGLSKAFHSERKQYCRIGSVKSNIGHCESAAGISGVTKVLLQMKHKQLVPSLHSQTLNPNIRFSDSPFVVQQELESWETESGKRRLAGVSSFGAGGSNAHVILEEYVPAFRNAYEGTEPVIVPLSAKNTDRLGVQVLNLLEFLEKHPALNLYDIAYTLQQGREAMEERLALLAKDREDLLKQLKDYTEGRTGAIFTGNIKKAKTDFLLEGEEARLYVESAIRNKSLKSLAQFWVKGGSVSWQLLYGANKPRRISLPAYPFAKERYWLKQVSGTVSVNNGSSKIHPLLHFREDNGIYSLPQKLNK